jgi:hypothetical protein
MTMTATTMTGGGDYDRNARVQATAASFALPLLERAAREAGLPPEPQPVMVVDYGSATGKNSSAVMALALSVLRSRTNQPIWVAHNDQPANDFNVLFATLSAPTGYLAAQENMFACAVGRSFYEPVVPPALVSLGWSSTAAHWLSRVPAPLADRAWAPTARTPGAGPFLDQARRDWRRFLDLRAAELRPGGRMVVVVATVDDDGICGGEHALDGLDEALRAEVAAGAMSRREAESVVVPNFFLSRAELEAPFREPTLARHLRLLEHVRVTSTDPLWTAFEQTGDSMALGAAFAGWVRACSQSSLLGAFAPERDVGERARLIERIYAAVEAIVRETPEIARCAWRMAALHFGRNP